MAFDTDFPADSVEFCPALGNEDILACGTYKILQNDSQISTTTTDATEDEPGDIGSQKSSRHRIGKCILLRATENDNVEVLQEIDLPAVLDLKWSPYSNLLAIADSEGHVTLQKLTAEVLLQETQKVQCRPDSILCLSLDWSNRRTPNYPGSIAVSCSDGSVSILDVDSTGSYSENLSWHAHDFEPWITAWNYWDSNVVYSGGDDLKLKAWDVRQSPTTPISVNKRFDAGVTSIQSHPYSENIIAVGSYDSRVRIIDVRKFGVPVTEADVGGGAWRVKWHPNSRRSTDLLVACMHDGFKVLRFSESVVGVEASSISIDSEWEIIKRFDEHQSLAYGVDWSNSNSKDSDTLIASCSFYDHVLHTWRG